MKVKLDKFCNYWDEAALETLGSEFDMMNLMSAQPITNIDGTSILDYLVFDDGLIVEVPEIIEESVAYFKAPWD